MCGFLWDVWLCIIFTVLLYMEIAMISNKHLNYIFCLTRSISSLVFQYLLACALMPRFQQFNGLCSRSLQTVGHLVLEDPQNWGLSALKTFTVILGYFLFRGYEMWHMHFIIDFIFVTCILFFQMCTSNRKIKFKLEIWYTATSTI